MACDGVERIGLAAECHQTPGHPVVVAEWRGAPSGAPTVLIYGHYDVQPPEPLELWTSPPFVGRSGMGDCMPAAPADDKGQVWIHVKALEACLTIRGSPAGQCRHVDRGGGGDREHQSSGLPGGSPSAAGVRLHRHLRYHDVCAPLSQTFLLPCAVSPTSRSPPVRRRPISTPDSTAASWRTRPRWPARCPRCLMPTAESQFPGYYDEVRDPS